MINQLDFESNDNQPVSQNIHKNIYYRSIRCKWIISSIFYFLRLLDANPTNFSLTILVSLWNPLPVDHHRAKLKESAELKIQPKNYIQNQGIFKSKCKNGIYFPRSILNFIRKIQWFFTGNIILFFQQLTEAPKRNRWIILNSISSYT